MGNLVNACVILISMAIFGLTGKATTIQVDPYTGKKISATLDPNGSRQVLYLTYGLGAFVCLVMVAYRLIFLKESEVRQAGSCAREQGRPAVEAARAHGRTGIAIVWLLLPLSRISWTLHFLFSLLHGVVLALQALL